ncbi:helix-turn-helix domain-containing protein [Myceligenerans pegani]|uniref:Helix-turn-helix domain-containing protein n=1 Tax=Myceligenerans pegani TaxID=2776917 RepID=A0ABR9N2L8_9MICO|nr:helix-turn-helix domain-containing protein [Myceligenerans sp. TRM 65318]MBE1877600.1 helix-turn-helix domain-containing protein [Myceligenerans sp. TRM 65318]MBE3019871.1 helix-turn-helix domain-containing protein [Myceligenerans sp. TRM 65318]
MGNVGEGAAAKVGRRIRALRTARGMSLTALAATAGIGKGSLSELETGRRNPTLDTLYAVAGPLGVPMAELVGDDDWTRLDENGIFTTRVRVLREDSRVTEVYLIRLAAGAVRRSPAHAAGAVERLVVLTGSGVVTYGDRRSELVTGDFVEFPADQPHSYTGSPDGGFEAVNVIVTPRT